MSYLAEAEIEEITYPWLVFKLKDRLFAVNSEHTSSIIQMPERVEAMPGAAKKVRGIINLRGSIIPLLDLRVIFDMPSMEQEYIEFRDMLEARKQDHLNWVKELKRCVETGDEFKLATDPHKCAFGRWYDSFETEYQTLRHHLNKINEPHKRLHRAAEEVFSCNQKHELCEREECLKVTLQRVEEEYVPKIVHLLDEAKELFRQQFHPMVVILNNGEELVGIIVDEVIAVENLEKIADKGDFSKFNDSQYMEGVSQRPGSNGLILMLSNKYFQVN